MQTKWPLIDALNKKNKENEENANEVASKD